MVHAYSIPQLFVVHLDQEPAKAARQPWELGALTKTTEDKYFGVKVFVCLSLICQAPTVDSDEGGHAQGALIARVSRTGALATMSGVYSSQLYAIMAAITSLMKNTNLLQVLDLGREKRGSGSVDVGRGNLALCTVNKLLEDVTWISERDANNVEMLEVEDEAVDVVKAMLHVCGIEDSNTEAAVIGILEEGFRTVRQKESQEGVGGSEHEDDEDDEDDSDDDDGDDPAGDAGGYVEGDSQSGEETGSPAAGGHGSGPTIACHCGLGRLLASDVTATLPKIQCIVLDEDDPKVENTVNEVREIAEAGRLHSTVTIISVPNEASTLVDSSDSDTDGASFDERVNELGSFLKTMLPGKYLSMVLQVRMTNPKDSGMVYRGKTPSERYHVDLEEMSLPTSTSMQKIGVLVLTASEDIVPKVSFDPEDPTSPWRKELSGCPFVLMGSSMTNLVSSTYWTQQISSDTKDKVKRTVESAKGGDIDRALSTEVFTTLLHRFATKGYSILGTWDPCGVVQSAAVELMLPSMCFLGLSKKQKVWRDEEPDLPILGWRNLPCASAFDISVVKPVVPEKPGGCAPPGKKRKAK